MENRVIGGYKVVRPLGQGTFGQTWLVEKQSQQYALKLFKNEMIRSDQDQKRIDREIATLQSVDHPYVVKYVDDGVYTEGYEQFRYLVMEYAEGEPLRTFIARHTKLTVTQVQRLGDQILQGLQAIHEAGLLHRDLKPDNIFVTRAGDIRILDFGLVKILDASTLTATGVPMGTFSYMAPEQLLDAKHVDFRADLYSVGAILFHMVTGRVPFEILAIVEAPHKILNIVPPFASTLNSAVPNTLDNLIATLLEKTVYRRTHTIDSIRRELRTLGAASTIPSKADLNLRLLPRLLHNERSLVEDFHRTHCLDGAVYPANFFPKYRAVFEALVSSGAFTLIDPVVYRLAYSKFTDTKSLVQLPYVLSELNKERPEDFDTVEACRHRAAQVLDWQRAQNPTALLAPFHFWSTADDPWVDVDLKVFHDCKKHLQQVGDSRPLYLGVSLQIESITDARSRVRLVNAISRVQADGYLLMFDIALDSFNRAHYYAYAEVVSVLATFRKPIVLSRVNDFGLGLTAFGATAISSGIGYIESFRESLLIEEGSNYAIRPKYYVPQLMTSFSEKGLKDVLEPALGKGLACDCPACQKSTSISYLLTPQVAKVHYLWHKKRQLQALNEMGLEDRFVWFQRQVDEAADLARRLKKANRTSAIPHEHFATWMEALTTLREEQKAAASRSSQRPS